MGRATAQAAAGLGRHGHGAKQVLAKACYVGTPELDRFTKGEDHKPGNILAVEVAPGIVRELLNGNGLQGLLANLEFERQHHGNDDRSD